MKNRQNFVRVATKEDYEQVFDRCIGKGYRNVHGLSKDSFPVSLNVIVIDDGAKRFGLTNVTCMAAATSQGKRTIGTEEYLRIIQNNCS